MRENAHVKLLPAQTGLWPCDFWECLREWKFYHSLCDSEENVLSLQEGRDETETWWNQEEIRWALTCWHFSSFYLHFSYACACTLLHCADMFFCVFERKAECLLLISFFGLHLTDIFKETFQHWGICAFSLRKNHTTLMFVQAIQSYCQQPCSIA